MQAAGLKPPYGSMRHNRAKASGATDAAKAGRGLIARVAIPRPRFSIVAQGMWGEPEEARKKQTAPPAYRKLPIAGQELPATALPKRGRPSQAVEPAQRQAAATQSAAPQVPG